MKKSLIALAVAGVIAAPAAMAEVTIYGAARASFDSADNGAGGTRTTMINDQASRIGFKGTEDLGGGTSAFFQVEQGFATDTGGGAWASRDTWVGLTGESWGTLQLGHGDSPAKGVTKGLDLFGDTAGNDQLVSYNNGAVGDPGGVVAYASPDMSGFQIIGAWMAQAEGANTSASPKDTRYSLGLKYASGPLYVGLGYDNAKDDTAPSVTYTETTLGVGYGFTDALWGSLTYQRQSATDNSTNRNNLAINGKYSFGSDAVKLQYSKAGNLNGAANTGANQVSLGYDHGMSKNTTVYALYSRVSNDSASTTYTTAGGNSAVTNGGDPSVLSVGINHSF